jgi:fibronectin type 3 domain-containing protein
MAGTLTVQNLQGPASGANANKIIVPSGQTLDTSAGSVIPSSGQTVQTVWVPATSTLDTTSTSYVTWVSTSFTPKLPSSRIVAQWSGHVYKPTLTTESSAAAQLLYGGVALWNTSYLHYSYNPAPAYMYAGLGVGSFVQTTGATETVKFHAKGSATNRVYIYASSGGLLIREIAL